MCVDKVRGDVEMYKILIVEDDDAIAGVLQRTLAKWGYEVCRTEEFENVMDEFLRFEPHLVLMDVSLPFFDGYHWCAEIRKVSKVPVLFLMPSALARTLPADGRQTALWSASTLGKPVLAR